MGQIFEDSGEADNGISKSSWADWYYKVRIKDSLDNFRHTLYFLADGKASELEYVKKMRVVQMLDFLEQKIKEANKLREIHEQNGK